MTRPRPAPRPRPAAPRHRGALPGEQQHQVDLGDRGGHLLRGHHQGAARRRGPAEGHHGGAAGEVRAGGALAPRGETPQEGQLLVKNLAGVGTRGQGCSVYFKTCQL